MEDGEVTYLTDYVADEDGLVSTRSLDPETNTVIDTPDLTPLIDAIFAHYLGWKSDPEHLYFRFELEQLSPEKIIIPGESTFPKKQMENKNKLK